MKGMKVIHIFKSSPTVYTSNDNHIGPMPIPKIADGKNVMKGGLPNGLTNTATPAVSE